MGWLPGLVVLVALVVVVVMDAATEKKRMECEAREVMRRFRTPEDRAAYFAGVEKRRGPAAAYNLKQEIARQAREMKK